MWETRTRPRAAATKLGPMRLILTAVRRNLLSSAAADSSALGEPAAHQWQGKYFQLDDVLGVEEERGFNSEYG